MTQTAAKTLTRTLVLCPVLLLIPCVGLHAQTGNGSLKVTSFPSGARVVIDGVDTGKNTPMSTSLSIGDHAVVVAIPDSGWNADTRTVTIVSGNNDLSVTLLPSLAVGPAGPAGPQGPPGPPGTAGLANFSCPAGQSITGFGPTGVPVCAAIVASGGGTGGGPTDTDGDGIPDTLDPCPSFPNLSYNGGSYCPVSTYDINKGLVVAGATVFVNNVVVTGVSGTSMIVETAATDPLYFGPDYNPLDVKLGTLPPPVIGSVVNVIGLVTAGSDAFCGPLIQCAGSLAAAAVVVLATP